MSEVEEGAGLVYAPAKRRTGSLRKGLEHRSDLREQESPSVQPGRQLPCAPSRRRAEPVGQVWDL